MTLQNRVRPDGALVADPARGTLYGNRGGRFHDPSTRTIPGRRRWASRHWICCVLEFRGRHHPVWEHRYTALFFLDEVTALSAGHRPCAECRRRDARAFQAAVGRGLGREEALPLDEIDRRAHEERLVRRPGEPARARTHPLRLAALPDGAVIAEDGAFLAVRGDALLPWSFEGYGPPRPRPTGRGIATVLTPPTLLAALAGGYAPLWHPSADA